MNHNKMHSKHIFIHHLLKEFCVLFAFFTYGNVVDTVAPPGLSMNCYVCNSGPPSKPNKNCPPSGITAPYLIHNEACYESCFIKTHIHSPNVIYRGCTDAYPGLPTTLPVDKCHTYADEIWCFCKSNMCNRGSLDNLQNPQEEEEEEEEEEDEEDEEEEEKDEEKERGRGRGRGEFRGKQRFPSQLAPRGNTHSKMNKKPSINLPLQPKRDHWPTPSSNQVRPHWHLKRIPPEISAEKSSDNGAEAYLDVRVTNTSLNITIVKDSQREQTNETIREFEQGRSTGNHLFCCQRLNVVRSVVWVFLFALVFS